MDYIFLFPGQGAQYIGMGQDFYHADASVKELFSIASSVGGFDLPDLLFNGTIEELSATDKTQIAVTTVNIAAAYYLRSRGVHPARVAGFSLGEYAALAIAGILSVEDALRAVKMRGDIMERVSRTHDDGSERSGLIAVIGMSREKVAERLANANVDGAFIAIHNNPEQIVVGGTPRGLSAASSALKDDAMQLIRLKVSGPFHTSLMETASDQYAEAIADIPFHNPNIPIYSNVSGAIVSSGEEMKRLCVVQLTRVVEWVREQQQLIADSGSDTLMLEVGPGRVLRGLWRKLARSYSADEREQLPKIVPAGTCEDVVALDKN